MSSSISFCICDIIFALKTESMSIQIGRTREKLNNLEVLLMNMWVLKPEVNVDTESVHHERLQRHVSQVTKTL